MVAFYTFYASSYIACNRLTPVFLLYLLKTCYNRFKYGFLYLITFIIVLGGDLVTKLVVNESMQLGQSYQVIKNFFYFTYIHNTGAAWGMLSGHFFMFYAISIIAGIMLIYYFIKSDKSQVLLRFGIVLIFSGMLGNLYDRVVFHYVRDFLDFFVFGYDFPIFNIADMGVVIGVLLIILDLGIGEYKQWKYNQLHQN